MLLQLFNPVNEPFSLDRQTERQTNIQTDRQNQLLITTFHIGVNIVNLSTATGGSQFGQKSNGSQI